MRLFLLLANDSLFVYYLICNIAYLTLLIVAFVSSAAHQRRLASVRFERLRLSPLSPPISLLVPAHNEERSIAEAVKSFLSLDYPALELIVINDGSKDATLARLTAEYQLLETDMLYISEVPCKPIRGVYLSQVEPRLLVVDKEAGGSKADATNAGLNVASSPYICVLDADAILEKDALLRIIVPIIHDPLVVAAGGIVRVVNNCRTKGGQMAEVRLPRHWIEIIQVIEYLRAFLIGREGWAQFDLLLIISGAFGVFRRDLVRQIGGYRPSAIGEDMDLVVRLHRYLREQGRKYRIKFIPDPVCWTEVPGDLKSLARQRARWQKGLLDVLWPNRDMLFRPKYGALGVLGLPYYWMFELFAPVVEIGGIFTIVLAAVFGFLSRTFLLEFLLFGYAFATLISVGAVLQEEVTYRRYNNWKDVWRLILFCFLEHFPYRQMHMVWRLQGLWQYLCGDHVWRPMKRIGFASEPAGK